MWVGEQADYKQTPNVTFVLDKAYSPPVKSKRSEEAEIVDFKKHIESMYGPGTSICNEPDRRHEYNHQLRLLINRLKSQTTDAGLTALDVLLCQNALEDFYVSVSERTLNPANNDIDDRTYYSTLKKTTEFVSFRLTYVQSDARGVVFNNFREALRVCGPGIYTKLQFTLSELTFSEETVLDWLANMRTLLLNSLANNNFERKQFIIPEGWHVHVVMHFFQVASKKRWGIPVAENLSQVKDNYRNLPDYAHIFAAMDNEHVIEADFSKSYSRTTIINTLTKKLAQVFSGYLQVDLQSNGAAHDNLKQALLGVAMPGDFLGQDEKFLDPEKINAELRNFVKAHLIREHLIADSAVVASWVTDKLAPYANLVNDQQLDYSDWQDGVTLALAGSDADEVAISIQVAPRVIWVYQQMFVADHCSILKKLIKRAVDWMRNADGIAQHLLISLELLATIKIVPEFIEEKLLTIFTSLLDKDKKKLEKTASKWGKDLVLLVLLTNNRNIINAYLGTMSQKVLFEMFGTVDSNLPSYSCFASYVIRQVCEQDPGADVIRLMEQTGVQRREVLRHIFMPENAFTPASFSLMKRFFILAFQYGEIEAMRWVFLDLNQKFFFIELNQYIMQEMPLAEEGNKIFWCLWLFQNATGNSRMFREAHAFSDELIQKMMQLLIRNERRTVAPAELQKLLSHITKQTKVDLFKVAVNQSLLPVLDQIPKIDELIKAITDSEQDKLRFVYLVTSPIEMLLTISCNGPVMSRLLEINLASTHAAVFFLTKSQLLTSENLPWGTEVSQNLRLFMLEAKRLPTETQSASVKLVLSILQDIDQFNRSRQTTHLQHAVDMIQQAKVEILLLNTLEKAWYALDIILGLFLVGIPLAIYSYVNYGSYAFFATQNSLWCQRGMMEATTKILSNITPEIDFEGAASSSYH